MSEMDAKRLGVRIREARERAGLSQAELGAEVGLERTVVNKVEGGSRKVAAVELSDIARALGVRMASFFEDPIPALVSHRSSQGLDTTDSKIDHLLARLASDVEFVYELVPALGLHELTPQPQPASAEEAEALAVWVRAETGLNVSERVQDIVEVAAGLGLMIFSTDLGPDTADAGTILLRVGGVSLVNSHNKVGRRRLAAAHELGHYVIADDYTVDWQVGDAGGDIESRLDRFARALLLPAVGVREEWARLRESYPMRETVVQLASAYRVDMATLARRLRELELIDSVQAGEVRRVRTTRADIVELNLHNPDILKQTTLPRQFQKAVLQAYRDERISSERALDLLMGTYDPDDLPDLRQRRADEIWNFVS